MEHSVTRYDDQDNEYTIYLDVDYDATPEEYEAGYYFGGGVCIERATIESIEYDEENSPPPPDYLVVGAVLDLTSSEERQLAESIHDSIVRHEGRYPRMNISPDW